MGSNVSFYNTTGPTYQGENPASSSNDGELVIVVDGGGNAINTGIKGDFPITFGCTINSVILVSDQPGDVVVNILSAPLGNTPTSSICGSDLPTLASSQTMQDTKLTGWNVSVSPLTVLRISINSVSVITRLTIVLKITKG